MRIALYVSGMKDGGAERTMANIANYMDEHGHEVIMVNVYRAEGEYYLNPSIKRVICEPDESELNHGRIGNFMARFNKLRSVWKDERPDVIFSYTGKTNIMTILTSRGLKASVGVGVVGTPELEYYNPVLKWCARNVFKMADKVVLQTEASKAFFGKKVLKKSVIMRNPMTEEFDIDYYEGEREKVIVSVGRIDENKNHQLIIDAFANICNKYPDYKLVIYGDGELRKSLIDRVESLGLSDRIKLPGRITNVAETIKITTAFVLASNTEGSPNALIEAMMLGLPVISTDCPCGGPGELIEDGTNGLLIPVGDVLKMQESLQKILDDLQFRNKIGRAALKTRDLYSPKVVLREWEELFKSMENTEKSR